MGIVQKFDFPQGVADCVASLHHIEELPEVSGGVGTIGFCLGGTLAYLTAAVGVAGLLRQLLRLGRRRHARPARQHRVPCPLPLRRHRQLHPHRTAGGRPSGVGGSSGHDLNVEPAGHAFDNHESEMFWNEAAAASAWEKTTAFLARHLPTG